MPMKNRKLPLTTAALITTVLFVVVLSAQNHSSEFRPAQRRIARQSLSNTDSQLTEHSIRPANVKGISPRPLFTAGGDVSATPTVPADTVLIEPHILIVDRHAPRAQFDTQILIARRYDTFWNTGDEALARAALAPNFTDNT